MSHTRYRRVAHRLIASLLLDLFTQQPQVEGFVVDGGHRNTWIALLLVIPVELFQEVDLGAG